jgi:hypothetical protein
VTSIPDFKPTATAFAPVTIAALAIIIGAFVPFIGLPLAMIAVVAIAAANITDRRLLYVTVAAVAVSITINLVLVMLDLPAAQALVQGA